MTDETLINKAEREIENLVAKKDAEKEKVPVLTKLLQLVDEAGIDLFLDETAEPHITFAERPLAAFPVASNIFRRYLRKIYWETEEAGCSSETLNQVIGVLEGKADSEKKTIPLFNRVAWHGGKIYYDLGNDKQAIEIDADGWREAINCPVRFRRFKHQLVQVMPQAGGNWEEIMKYINLHDPHSQLLYLTYVPTILISHIPRAIIVCAGDQGAAKSTALRVARSLVDPSSADLLSPPRDIIELGQAANHHYCLYLDNLSPINDELSDVLCRLVTGIGFTKRKLYTDDEDILFNQKVAIGLTGIHVVAQKPDVVDRSLILNFERVDDARRLEEEEFWVQFEAEKPLLLGALFSVVSGILKTVPNIRLAQKPRMADYAKYAAAAAVTLGKTAEELLAAFSENTRRQNNAAIDSSPTAQVILEFMKDRNDWEGASSELYGILRILAERANLPIGGQKAFPKGSNWLAKRIKEIKPNLQSLGYGVACGEISSGSTIHIWRISPIGDNSAITASAATGNGESSDVLEGFAATDTAIREEPSLASKVEEDGRMVVMAAIPEIKKCGMCGLEKFWTRSDGEVICAVCHPPPGK